MKKTVHFLLASVLLALLVSSKLVAGPPTPPAGYHWQVVSALTDEFDGNELDGTKWLDYNPYWIGRAPGLFKPAQVSISKGELRLTNKKVAATTATYWVHTGFVASKSKTAYTAGMYSECKMMCAKDGTVTGFWMSKPQSGTKQEIDVQEGVGWSPNGNQAITKLMRMNTHDAAGETEGANESIGEVGDNFHTYGVWWKDKRNINMYHGSTKVASIYTTGDFTGGMQLNLNTETQTWLGDPNTTYLANENLNATVIKYIRTWQLVKNTTPATVGQIISLQNIETSKYISSEDGASTGMNCNRNSVNTWEKFTITDLGGGKHSLKGNNGKFVSSENGTKKVTCSRTNLGAWEKFTFKHFENQIYSIQGSNGKYLGSDMMCNKTTQGNAEKFKITWGLKGAVAKSLNSVENDVKTSLNPTNIEDAIIEPSSSVLESKVKVYPNPASDELNISWMGAGEYQALIYNTQGILVDSHVLNADSGFSTINISDFESDVYILKVQNEKTSNTIRFIKQ